MDLLVNGRADPVAMFLKAVQDNEMSTLLDGVVKLMLKVAKNMAAGDNNLQISSGALRVCLNHLEAPAALG